MGGGGTGGGTARHIAVQVGRGCGESRGGGNALLDTLLAAVSTGRAVTHAVAWKGGCLWSVVDQCVVSGLEGKQLREAGTPLQTRLCTLAELTLTIQLHASSYSSPTSLTQTHRQPWGSATVPYSKRKA